MAYLLFAVSGPAPAAWCGIRACWHRDRLRGNRRTLRGAAFAPVEIRGSAFGLLATVQATGNGAASAVAGLLYTVALSAVAFGYLVVWMVAALVALGWALTGSTPATA